MFKIRRSGFMPSQKRSRPVNPLDFDEEEAASQEQSEGQDKENDADQSPEKSFAENAQAYDSSRFKDLKITPIYPEI
ncbi:MAG: hypothetical protein ACI9BD_001349 [Candidatus Marinamargulisbacteria bacterium]